MDLEKEIEARKKKREVYNNINQKHIINNYNSSLKIIAIVEFIAIIALVITLICIINSQAFQAGEALVDASNNIC